MTLLYNSAPYNEYITTNDIKSVVILPSAISTKTKIYPITFKSFIIFLVNNRRICFFDYAHK